MTRRIHNRRAAAQRRRYTTAPSMLSLCALLLGVGAQSSPAQILRPQGTAVAEVLTIDRVVRLTLRLPVTREAAFDAWTDATQLVEWLSHWAEMKVVEGESFRIGWEGYDGVWQGRYVEVSRPERLVFTWLPPETIFPAGAYETRVTLTFEPEGDQSTLMTLEHSGFVDTPEMEAQLQVWRGYLFALRAFLLQAPVRS